MTMTHQQFHQRIDTRHTIETAFSYLKGSPMLTLYLESNEYNRITFGKHHFGDDCWQVWMMRRDSSCGHYTIHRTRADAQRAALRLSQHTGLPLTDD